MQTSSDAHFGSIMFLLLLLLIIIPLSLLLWMISLFTNTYDGSLNPISPWKFLISLILPIVVADYGFRRRSLDRSGALASLVVGFVMTVSNYCFMASLMTFFLSSSRVTKLRAARKREIEDGYKEGGQRNWKQVLANGGVATQLAIIYMLDYGCRENVLDFSTHYNSTWLSLAVLSALCCSAGDTWSSEIGSVYGQTPVLITTREKVPRGTNGGVTVVGLVASAVAGLFVGLAYFLTLHACLPTSLIAKSPPQAFVIFVGLLGGLLGSLVDSVLGATLQYSGYCETTGRVVEVPSESTKRISGMPLLDNHSVNLFASLITALTMPGICFLIWP